MKLLSDRILVEAIAPPSSRAGIFFPDIALDDVNIGGPKLYRVISVGPGARTPSGTVAPMECAPGDRVICHSYHDGAQTLPDGRKILRQSMVLAVLPKHETPQT